MAELKLNIEEGDGCYYAHAVELLGCFSKANSKSEAIDMILRDVKNYSEWLLTIEGNTEYQILAKEFQTGITDFDIVEDVQNIPMLSDSCGTSALFESDKELIEETKFEFYLSIINKLPENLLRIVFQLSNDERDTTIIEERPTINEELLDFYNAEMFYISRFGEIVEQKFFETIDMTKDELESLTVLERVIKIRQGAVSLLRYYYKKIGDTIFLSQDNTEVPEEEWTIKKIVRKFIEHERERTATIKVLVDKLEESKSKENSE